MHQNIHYALMLNKKANRAYLAGFPMILLGFLVLASGHQLAGMLMIGISSVGTLYVTTYMQARLNYLIKDVRDALAYNDFLAQKAQKEGLGQDEYLLTKSQTSALRMVIAKEKIYSHALTVQELFQRVFQAVSFRKKPL